MRFLFRLDLSLHAGAGIFFWNFDFENQTRPKLESGEPHVAGSWGDGVILALFGWC